MGTIALVSVHIYFSRTRRYCDSTNKLVELLRIETLLQMKIHPFSPFESVSEQVDAWYALKVDLRKEVLPDEPILFSRDSLLERVISMRSIQESQRWAVWSDDGITMVGLAGVYRSTQASDSSPTWISLEVGRDHRRKGIGRALLERVAAVAAENQWPILKVKTCNRSHPGEVFARKSGAKQLHEGYTSRLTIKDVDAQLLGEWLQFPHGNPGIVLNEWTGPYPEDKLQEVSDFYQAVYDDGNPGEMNSRFVFTPANVRKGEKIVFSGSNIRLIVYAAEEHSGRLVGLTEITWSKSEPSVLSQGYTAVLPGSRGRGIARRLKAHMLVRIHETIPGALYLKTGNAGSNHKILNINTYLGFKRQLTRTTWQFKTSELIEYLESTRS